MRGAARPRGPPLLTDDERAPQEFRQPLERRGLVLLLAAELLRLDHDDAVARDPVIAELEQPLPAGLGQCGGARGVEAQLYRTRNLVHVLTAGALRANGGELELGVRNLDA